MFDTEQVPLYLDDIGHRVMKDKSGDEYKVVDLTFRLEPLTANLAAEVAGVVKMTLFKKSDGDPTDGIKSVVFNEKPKPQAIHFYPDKGMKTPTLRLHESKITNLKARKPKDGTHWVFSFRATVAQLSGDDLLYLQEALYKQHFLTFANAKAGLFDDEEKTEKRTRGRGMTSGDGEAATAH